jgi:hypothetical protein
MIEKIIFIKDGKKTIIENPEDIHLAAAKATLESWNHDNPDNLATLEIVETEEKEKKEKSK